MLAWGKTPIRCTDSPGFVVNRVNRPFTLEALRMLEGGSATIEEIDAAVRAEGFPQGPFEHIDLIGLDVNLATSRAIHAGLGVARAARAVRAPGAARRGAAARAQVGRRLLRVRRLGPPDPPGAGVRAAGRPPRAAAPGGARRADPPRARERGLLRARRRRRDRPIASTRPCGSAPRTRRARWSGPGSGALAWVRDVAAKRLAAIEARAVRAGARAVRRRRLSPLASARRSYADDGPHRPPRAWRLCRARGMGVPWHELVFTSRRGLLRSGPGQRRRSSRVMPLELNLLTLGGLLVAIVAATTAGGLVGRRLRIIHERRAARASDRLQRPAAWPRWPDLLPPPQSPTARHRRRRGRDAGPGAARRGPARPTSRGASRASHRPSSPAGPPPCRRRSRRAAGSLSGRPRWPPIRPRTPRTRPASPATSAAPGGHRRRAARRVARGRDPRGPHRRDRPAEPARPATAAASAAVAIVAGPPTPPLRPPPTRRRTAPGPRPSVRRGRRRSPDRAGTGAPPAPRPRPPAASRRRRRSTGRRRRRRRAGPRSRRPGRPRRHADAHADTHADPHAGPDAHADAQADAHPRSRRRHRRPNRRRCRSPSAPPA